eukprot:CAMPEP_0182924888 /NCGR_PEP_ID=MMETSP0105_2-20130417/7891_1 /TAXON_ID=81532 ORGANISM="Acanthoeca-like sp., Strain 10tr" /NCGR_SAMPLE_ID=MMETSP0105_2 /ASSEMBLY_ACC=CAM_ASM_000205 /LENGTH=134 /DNA_ID=CAMNT_0025062709 /DNA_START=31 /DNA_END=435 /DNA_ORIENTATION=+
MPLTEEQIEVATNAFAIFAGNRGSVNRAGLANCCSALGLAPKAAQLPGGDSFDCAAVIQFAGSLEPPTDKENDELAAAFRVFDISGQGIIAAEEFANQAKILGEGLTEDEAAQLLKYAPDGKLNYKELLAKMTA